MKKILLAFFATLICFTMVACSSEQTNLASSIEDKLERLNSSINSVPSISNNDIKYNSKFEIEESSMNAQENKTNYSSPDNTLSRNPVVKNLSISEALESCEKTQETNICVNSCKKQILELIEMLNITNKKIKSNEIKLNKSQIESINELLSSIELNTSRISMTKNEINAETGKVKMLLNDKENNPQKLNARFIRLNNSLQTRLTYYKNILSVLNQIRTIIACENGNCDIQDGNVCIDGKCIDDSSISNYGDSCPECVDELDIDNTQDKVSEEQKIDNIVISDTTWNENQTPKVEKLEDKNNTDTNINEQITPKSDVNYNKDNQQNYRITPNQIPKREQIQNKNDATSNEYNSQNTNRQIPSEKEDLNSNQSKNDNRKNIDTYKHDTLKKNVNSFRKANNKIVSPSVIWIEWASRNIKPFPDKITETNIEISNDSPDTKFVDKTTVSTEDSHEEKETA